MAFCRRAFPLLLLLTLAGVASAQVPPPAQPPRQAPPTTQPQRQAPPTAQPSRQAPLTVQPPPQAQPTVQPAPQAPPTAQPSPPAPPAAQPSTQALPTAQPPRPALPTEEITIATRAIEPFIIQEGDQVTGFSADLWRAIAAELGLKSRFVTYRTLPELLGSVGKNDAAGIAAISITADREKTFDFSQPMFRSGLSIMVPDNGQQLDVFNLLFSTQMLKAIGIFLLILIIPAHLIWFLARGRDEGLPVSQAYIPGIFDAVFWCAESMGGAAQAHPTRVLARVAALIWIYAGLVFVAYFTAYATTSLTMQSLKGSINGPNDLAGKQVAVIQGSTSARYTAGLRARTTNYPDFKSAAAAMLAGKAEAVVYDSPVILYFVKNNPAARVAGSAFRSENYGIIFPLGSPLRRPVNEALLTLFETGTYDSLYKKWFGEQNIDAN